MEKELLNVIRLNFLSPFNKAKTRMKKKGAEIFKTKDARVVFDKTIEKISFNFEFKETENLWNAFPFTSDLEDIEKRQEFFKKLEKKNSQFLHTLATPRNWWKPRYGIMVVTEDEDSFSQLQKLNVPVQFISSLSDVQELGIYDIIQAVNCDESRLMLEKLPQSVFLDSVDEVYLERYVEILSGWQKNLEILRNSETSDKIKSLVSEIYPLLRFVENKASGFTLADAEDSLEKINISISDGIKNLSVNGNELLEIMSQGKLPGEMQRMVDAEIVKTGLPVGIFKSGIPVSLDEHELEKILRDRSLNEFSELAEEVKRNAKALVLVPKKFKEIEEQLLILDFISGISSFLSESSFYPEVSSDFYFSEAENIFLDKPEPISFSLDSRNKCSMLTGANSGGKTTLIEHVIQLVTFFQLGLPVKGKVSMPLFTDIYYFAKTKGASSRGAFENLLSQMASIKPGPSTLILADEIEAVTEPGIAGRIISATAEFFINKGAYLVIATHLGREIEQCRPELSRIDGIEARGLDENNELIVNHNPVLGKLASSTPELIIEKMANTNQEEYFKFLRDKIRTG